MIITAIIGVVAYILWPVHADGYPSQPLEACYSNLKQVGTCALIYVTDFDDRFPLGDKWMDELRPYYKNEQILHCPMVSQGSFGYAMSDRAAGIKFPSDEVAAKSLLIFDSTLLTRNAVSNFTTLPNPPRHERNNVGYMDSHVRSFPRAGEN